MNESEQQTLLKKNTILWIAAMAIAPIFDLGLKALATGPVKFPWVILTPLFMVGLYAASNGLLKEALGASDNDDGSSADAT